MKTISTSGWNDYSLLDSGDGYRLEQFGKFRLSRPDPQAIWSRKLPESEWRKSEAAFLKDKKEKEYWQKKQTPTKWIMRYKDISFYAKLTPFKHTGIFPEQHLQWDWMEDKIRNSSQLKSGQKPKILNLFAYTGISSLIAAKNNCEVTHVDASSPSIAWARENQTLSKLSNKPIRWIKEDVLKYCQRELKRGHRYDAIIMDPPIYGHGPHSEVWDFYKSFPILLALCRGLLTKKPIFIIINAYAISASSLMLENMLADSTQGINGTIESGELCLEEKNSSRLLSTGIFSRIAFE